MEIKKTIEIKRFILFVATDAAAGMGNIVYSSDQVMSIYRWLDGNPQCGKSVVILDTDLSETTAIDVSVPRSIENYHPNMIQLGSRVWAVSEGLPAGRVVSVGDTLTIETDNGESITVEKEKCLFDFGYASETN